jgi:MFS-type transporter involved in bile tolerance (Atg22 family)
MTIQIRRETIISQDEDYIEGEDGARSDSIHGHNYISSHIPRFLRFDGAPVEATGLSVDMYTRATIVMSSLFLGPALLELAKEDVRDQCIHYPEDSMEWTQCIDNTRIHGFKPSSLLSNIAIAGGMMGAFILPPVGVIVDMTPYRRQVGMYSAFLLTLVKPIELMIGQSTWLAISWLQVITGFLFCIHISSIFAYVSELSDEPNQQARYNTHYFVVMYMSTLVFMVETLLIALILDTDSVGTARIALAITTINCALGFPLAWKYLFRDRPPLTKVEDGRSVLFSGFRALFMTSRRIHQDLPALRWLMLAVIFGEGANTAVVTIGTTFMVHFLKMDGRDVGIVFLVILVTGPIGSKLGEFIALRSSPVTSAKVCLLTYILTQTLAAVTLTGPERSQYTCVFGIAWGMCLGWLHPMLLTTFVTIRPSGMDAQMMSFYLFCGTGFTWLPPLLFTVCNEFGIPISWSMLSLNLFFLLGIVCLFVMGDYRMAIEAGKALTDTIGGNELSSVANSQNGHAPLPVEEYADADADAPKVMQKLELPTIT